MYRGTTPTHTFALPFDTSIIDALLITYTQRGVKIIEKTLDDVTLNGRRIVLKLTQDETNMFNKGNKAQIQLRVKSGDSVQASKIIDLDVQKVLNNEVM
jgi:hypothetical protein